MLGTLQKAFQQVNTSNTEYNLFNISENSQNIQLSLFDNPETSQYKTIKDIEHSYYLIENKEDIYKLVSELLLQKEVCFDTETTSLNELEAELVGMAFSWEKHKGYYVLFPESKELTQEILEIFRPFFENSSITKIGQNLKYDIKVLAKYNIQVLGNLFDTMIAHYLLNPDAKHNMDILSENYLHYSPISIETLIGKKGKGQLSMRQVPPQEQKEYAVEDTDVTLQLKNIFEQQLQKYNAEKLFSQIESPLVQVLADMELEGIRIDVPFLKSLSNDIEKDIFSLQQAVYEQAGEIFNLSSPKQLGDILFEKLKLISKPKKTKTGQYATSEEILSELAPKHKIVANVLEYRQLQKLQSTYIDALPKEVNSTTGRVHTTYMQAVTATGRLSSNNPNLQNIPIRTERGQQIRKAFVPRNEDYTLLSADYSQIELRVIAALSGEKNMIEAFLQNQDML